MTDIKDPCLECGKETNRSGYSNGEGGFWHSHCYNRLNPPRAAKGIHDVIQGGADPVIARDVLYSYFDNQVPASLCEQVVDEYNRQLMTAWRRRCEP